jgi:hypothetical protein
LETSATLYEVGLRQQRETGQIGRGESTGFEAGLADYLGVVRSMHCRVAENPLEGALLKSSKLLRIKPLRFLVTVEQPKNGLPADQ